MIFNEHDFKANPELSNNQLTTLRFISPHMQIEDNFWATVVKVHDADTVTLRTDFRDFDFPVRLANINALELSEGGDVPRDWLINRVLGKEVFVLIDHNNRIGKYGRIIGELLVDGFNVNDEMLLLGIVPRFGYKDEGKILDTSFYVRDDFIKPFFKILSEVAF